MEPAEEEQQSKAKPLTLSQRKRLAIIEAAIIEFQVKGFQSASMDAISQRAKVSKRTVYNHFQSKDQLFEAIAQRLCGYSEEVTRLEFHQETPLVDQLYDFAKKELALFAAEHYRELARVMLAESIRSPELAQRIMVKLQQQGSDLEKWIHSAVQAQRIRPVPPGYAAAQFIGIIKANAFWPQLLMNTEAPDTEFAEQIAQDAAQMFLNYYQLK